MSEINELDETIESNDEKYIYQNQLEDPILYAQYELNQSLMYKESERLSNVNNWIQKYAKKYKFSPILNYKKSFNELMLTLFIDRETCEYYTKTLTDKSYDILYTHYHELIMIYEQITCDILHHNRIEHLYKTINIDEIKYRYSNNTDISKILYNKISNDFNEIYKHKLDIFLQLADDL